MKSYLPLSSVPDKSGTPIKTPAKKEVPLNKAILPFIFHLNQSMYILIDSKSPLQEFLQSVQGFVADSRNLFCVIEGADHSLFHRFCHSLKDRVQ